MKRRFVFAAVALLLCAAFFVQAVPAFAWTPDNVVYANADPNRYEIEVDLVNQVVTVTDTTDGSIALQAICTTGEEKPSTITPTGTWRLNSTRRRFGYFTKYECYAQYWMQVVGGIYFHSILYSRPVEGYFTRTSYYDLGTPASHGCIRMLVDDIRWMYYHCPPGTQVTITDEKPKDEALRQSLLPTLTHREYMPGPDEYEATPRGEAQGVARRGSVLTTEGGQYLATVARGEYFQILYPGPDSTRVLLDGGEIGYLETDRILFLDNSPNQLSYEAGRKLNLYARASTASDVLTTVERGTELRLLGETTNFYKVSFSGSTGYVLKKYVDTVSAAIDDIESLLDQDKNADRITYTVLRVKNDGAELYPRANTTLEPLTALEENTDLLILDSTESFYKVKAGEFTGYLLKRDCKNVRVTVTASGKETVAPSAGDEAPPADDELEEQPIGAEQK